MNKVKAKGELYWNVKTRRGNSYENRKHPWWVEMVIQMDGGERKLVTKYKERIGALSAATKLKKADCRLPFTVTVTKMGKPLC